MSKFLPAASARKPFGGGGQPFAPTFRRNADPTFYTFTSTLHIEQPNNTLAIDSLPQRAAHH